ncbi:assimilatory nitrate reductase catalytic subunit NasC [Bacillus taeanensis]|uniref:Nitrite reductase n=1 Tax=Bacillus taeanensis TaxID=273032 RepID=A0A366XXV2_9BACI|nr:molybdopterin oxidoreductase family protein [Bacillus taeanensis]RBW68974.1 nitrite reductase [Bacillus taeanensis]
MSDLLKHFRTKQQAVGSEKVYHTQCPYCSMQCKMELIEQRVVERKRFKVVPKNNPTSEGRLCIKGMNAHQHAVNKERITQPLMKKNGEFVPVSWEDALQFIKERFTAIQHEDGLNALSVYGGGSLTNEEAYLLGKFARVGLKTKYIDYNGRFCMSAAATAANQAFGMDRGLTNKLSEIPYSKCIILAGTNIAECQPTIMPYFQKAKENGAYIIAIDPRETATTKMADLHLKVRPGMDASLINGMLKTVVEEGYVDQAFIETRTNGFDELKTHLEAIDLKEIEALTGVSLTLIQKAAQEYGKAGSGMIFTARGVEQQTDGYMTVRNLLNMLLVTGKIGKIGSGYGAITGQGNGQGGREHGQKADQLPGYRSIENIEHRHYIADIWGIPESELPRKGVSAYEMMEKIHEGEITAMLVLGSNPVVSNPNALFVEEAMKKLKCLVVVDLFLSETGKYADLILPTSSYLENTGTMTNLEGRVTLREAAKPRSNEVKHDWEILCEIARVLGKEKYFSYESSEEIFNELRLASRGGIADYYGITYEKLRNNGVYWPCPSVEEEGKGRIFEESFAHKDGKGVIIPVENYVPKEHANEEYPLNLTTGRVMSHYLTGVQTRRSPTLEARNIEAFVEIHPNTAKKFKVKDKALVKVESIRGSIVVRSKFTESIREDTVFVPFHWGDNQCVNRLTSEELDPTCKMPGFKVCAVTISPLVDLTLN